MKLTTAISRVEEMLQANKEGSSGTFEGTLQGEWLQAIETVVRAASNVDLATSLRGYAQFFEETKWDVPGETTLVADLLAAAEVLERKR